MRGNSAFTFTFGGRVYKAPWDMMLLRESDQRGTHRKPWRYLQAYLDIW